MKTCFQQKQYLNLYCLSFGWTTVESAQQYLELSSLLLTNLLLYSYLPIAAELLNLFIFTTGLFSGVNTISNTVSVANSSRSANKLSIRDILDTINNIQQYFGVFEKYLTVLIIDIQIFSAQYNQNNYERLQQSYRQSEDYIYSFSDFYQFSESYNLSNNCSDPPRNLLNLLDIYNNNRNGNGKTEAGYWKTDKVGYFWLNIKKDIAIK